MEGLGWCFYRDQQIKYEGEWKNSSWHGKGIYYDNDGVTYKGSFEKGKRHGKFTIMPYSDDIEIIMNMKDD